MRVDIPSRGRPEIESQLAYNQFQKLKPTIWVRESERADYLQTFKSSQLISVDDGFNIAQVRDCILDFRRSRGEVFAMLDDGLQVRPSKKFSSVPSFSRLISILETRLTKYPVCGVNSSGNDGWVNDSWDDFSPKYVECNFWINPNILPESVRFYFGGTGTGEDICFNLRLALSGFMPQRYNRYKFFKRIWREGGCKAMGRTASTVSKDASLLRKLYPEFLKEREVTHPDGTNSSVNTLLLAKAFKQSTKKPPAFNRGQSPKRVNPTS